MYFPLIHNNAARTAMLLQSTSSREQAFALQYTAVILIVMTFIVGSFVRPHLPAAIEPVPMTPKIIGSKQVFDAFTGSTANIQNSALVAWSTFATQHDVDLNITVYGEQSQNSSTDRISLALARSVAVQRYFIDAGVQPKYIRVVASPLPESAQMLLEILPSQIN